MAAYASRTVSLAANEVPIASPSSWMNALIWSQPPRCAVAGHTHQVLAIVAVVQDPVVLEEAAVAVDTVDHRGVRKRHSVEGTGQRLSEHGVVVGEEREGDGVLGKVDGLGVRSEIKCPRYQQIKIGNLDLERLTFAPVIFPVPGMFTSRRSHARLTIRTQPSVTSAGSPPGWARRHAVPASWGMRSTCPNQLVFHSPGVPQGQPALPPCDMQSGEVKSLENHHVMALTAAENALASDAHLASAAGFRPDHADRRVMVRIQCC